MARRDDDGGLYRPRMRQPMDPNEAQPMQQTQPVGAPVALPDQGSGSLDDVVARARTELSTPSMPAAMPMVRGALARYGTGNIEGASGLRTGNARMSGYNTQGWGTDERGTNSIKNTFGKIASRYDAKPSSLAQILADPDFQRFFPDATLVEGGAGDKIDFGDGRPVDVLQSADPNADTAVAWDWMTEDGGAPIGGGLEGLGGAGGIDLASLLGGQGDPLNDIIAQIQEIQGGQSSAEQDALMRLLRGEQI